MADFSFLKPAYSPVALPSKGLLYTPDLLISSGFIHIRPYTGREEAIISTMNTDNWFLVINSILQSCIEENISVDLLTNEDSYYLLVWLRAHSYSPEYDVEAQCPFPACGRENQFVVNLATDLIFNDLSADVKEPLIEVLPVSGIQVYLNCMRRGTEIRAQKRKTDVIQMWNYPGDPTDILRRAYSTSKVILPSGEEVTNILELENLYLNFLSSADSYHIDCAIQAFNHGVDPNISLVCRSCERTMYTRLPAGQNFFRPEVRAPKKQDTKQV